MRIFPAGAGFSEWAGPLLLQWYSTRRAPPFTKGRMGVGVKAGNRRVKAAQGQTKESKDVRVLNVPSLLSSDSASL